MAASAPRKTPTRKAVPRKRAAKPPADLGIVLDDPAAQAEVEQLIADREPLFTVGGVTHTIPKRVPPSWSMKAYKIATEQGEAAALGFAVEKLLTDEAWEALQECETVTPTAWEKVLNALVDRILPDGVLGPKA
ncbi:hypothetical protein [Amycolatopsis sp. Hca4]|uniref:hypothetical protein n=1 Tax=Amycolatopsis sp. Hca4 TaxID=2742131 RepID=UPI0015913429|nr:hypothetical protein [Amycolatopsis sp. Hca4]QKV74536.1 hypothetical protein HUT10_12720 [Amycolatopsis sp. Hca4]